MRTPHPAHMTSSSSTSEQEDAARTAGSSGGTDVSDAITAVDRAAPLPTGADLPDGGNAPLAIHGRWVLQAWPQPIVDEHIPLIGRWLRCIGAKVRWKTQGRCLAGGLSAPPAVHPCAIRNICAYAGGGGGNRVWVRAGAAGVADSGCGKSVLLVCCSCADGGCDLCDLEFYGVGWWLLI